jgi:hypothetical protein
MTSPGETARDYQAGPQDNQNMPELNRDRAGARPEGDPQPPAQAASGYRALPPWAAPQRGRAWPAGMMLRHPSPSRCPRPASLGQPSQRR